MPDIFGNATFEELLSKRKADTQGMFNKALQQNFESARTGEERLGAGVGALLATLGKKYFPSDQPADTPAMVQAKAREEALARMADNTYSNKTQSTTPEGGITTTRVPLTPSEKANQNGDMLMEIALKHGGGANALKQALFFKQQAIDLNAAETEAAAKQSYLSTLSPTDRVAAEGGVSSTSIYAQQNSGKSQEEQLRSATLELMKSDPFLSVAEAKERANLLFTPDSIPAPMPTPTAPVDTSLNLGGGSTQSGASITPPTAVASPLPVTAEAIGLSGFPSNLQEWALSKGISLYGKTPAELESITAQAAQERAAFTSGGR